VMSPRPKERLRMISARRARLADLDKAISHARRRNLFAAARTFQCRRWVVNSGKGNKNPSRLVKPVARSVCMDGRRKARL
jgi:hypothetical protein